MNWVDNHCFHFKIEKITENWIKAMQNQDFKRENQYIKEIMGKYIL